MSHTKEPWSMFDAGRDIHINESSGAGFIGSIHIYEHRAEQCRENARRIVACVNACSGISTEALESGESRSVRDELADIATLEQQRDELLAALEKAAEVFDFYAKHHATKTIPEDDKARKNYEHRNMCRTAIASVKASAP